MEQRKKNTAIKILIFVLGFWLGSITTMIITLKKLKYLL